MSLFELLEQSPFVRADALLHEVKILGTTEGGRIVVWMKYDDGREMAVPILPKNLKKYAPPNRGKEGGQIAEPPPHIAKDLMADIPDELVHQMGKFTAKLKGTELVNILLRRGGASEFSPSAPKSVHRGFPQAAPRPFIAPERVDPIKRRIRDRARLPIAPRIKPDEIKPPKQDPRPLPDDDAFEPLDVEKGSDSYAKEMKKFLDATAGKLQITKFLGKGSWGAFMGTKGGQTVIMKQARSLDFFKDIHHKPIHKGKTAARINLCIKRMADEAGFPSMVPAMYLHKLAEDEKKDLDAAVDRNVGVGGRPRHGKVGECLIIMEKVGDDDCRRLLGEVGKKIPEEQKITAAVMDLLSAHKDHAERNVRLDKNGNIYLIDNNLSFNYNVGRNITSIFLPGGVIAAKTDAFADFPPKLKALVTRLSKMVAADLQKEMDLPQLEDAEGVIKRAKMVMEDGVRKAARKLYAHCNDWDAVH